MPKIKFSATALDKLRKEPTDQRTEWIDPSYPNLILRQTGKRMVWGVRQRRDGKRRWNNLGVYGSPPNGLSLAQAWRMRQDLLGSDDVRAQIAWHETQIKRLKTELGEASVSFDGLKTAWISHCKTRCRPNTVAHYASTYDIWIQPVHGASPVDLVTTAEISDNIDRCAKDSSPTRATAVLSIYRNMLSWGVRRGKIDNNAAQGIPDPGKRVVREKWYTSIDELAHAWQAIIDAPVSPPTRAAVELLMITGMRRSEVVAMEWAEIRPAEAELDPLIETVDAVIDSGADTEARRRKVATREALERAKDSVRYIWRIPTISAATGEPRIGTKSRKTDHLVPLTELSADIVDRFRGEHTVYVLPAILRSGHIGDDTATAAMTEIGRRLKEAGLAQHAVHLHGLRHNVASWLETLGYLEADVADALGHRRTSVTGGYMHAVKTSRQIEMALAWDDFLRRKVLPRREALSPHQCGADD